MIGIALAVAAVTLDPNGLGLSGRMLRFETPEAVALAKLSEVMDKPIKRGVYPDCGQGLPIGHVHFRGGLEVVFIKHRFVGWTIAEGGEKGWRSAKGVGLGSTLASIRRVQDVDLDDHFDVPVVLSEKGVSGFLSGKGPKAVLTEVHAGQTCIVG